MFHLNQIFRIIYLKLQQHNEGGLRAHRTAIETRMFYFQSTASLYRKPFVKRHLIFH